MSTRQKINIPAILILFCVILIFWNCDSYTVISESEDVSESEVSDFIGAIINEKMILLSLKYELEVEIVKQILTEYFNKHDLGFNLLNSLVTNKGTLGEAPADYFLNFDDNFLETIQNLNSKYEISKQKIASMIIEYKVLFMLEVLQEDIRELLWD